LACRLGPIDVLGHLTDFAFVRAGWLKGRRVMELLQSHFGDLAIEDLAIPFHAVAADLLTGDERVLSEGPVVAALRASISLPWVFEPVATADALLVDGGMTSPVPMRTARRLGATSLLAVHVAGDHPGRVAAARLELGRASMARGSKIAALAFAVQCDSLVRAERELARPDLFLEPQAGGHEMHAFHRARDLIAIGRAAAEAERHALLALREQRHFEAA
jgi:NTE family protein